MGDSCEVLVDRSWIRLMSPSPTEIEDPKVEEENIVEPDSPWIVIVWNLSLIHI